MWADVPKAENYPNAFDECAFKTASCTCDSTETYTRGGAARVSIPADLEGLRGYKVRVRVRVGVGLGWSRRGR